MEKLDKQKCACNQETCIGGAEVEIGGVCHRPNNPCYIIENQTINRIREECSVDYNLSLQITEVKEEWMETADRANDFTTYVKMSGSYVLNPEAIADWWLSKIDELLKSQEHKLREELVEKIEKYGTDMQGGNPLPTVQQAVIQGVLSLIKE